MVFVIVVVVVVVAVVHGVVRSCISRRPERPPDRPPALLLSFTDSRHAPKPTPRALIRRRGGRYMLWLSGLDYVPLSRRTSSLRVRTRLCLPLRPPPPRAASSTSPTGPQLTKPSIQEPRTTPPSTPCHSRPSPASLPPLRQPLPPRPLLRPLSVECRPNSPEACLCHGGPSP